MDEVCAQDPAPAYVATLGEPARDALRDELAHVLVPDAGRIRLSARAWAVAGRAG